MQKLLFILSATLLLVYCKPKKAVATNSSPKSTLSILEVANKKWANTSQGELDEGKIIYEGKCTKCHGQKKIVTRSEKNWLHEIDVMSPKAKLTEEEKLKLTKYILSYREANTTTE